MKMRSFLSAVSLLLVFAICASMLTACDGGNNIGGFEGFVKVSGTKLYDENGKEFHIKSMGMGNDVWNNPTTDTTVRKHHNEASYVELAELGFNSVRFYLNYGLFEDDANPYVYKETAWKWLDDNVEWAKKAGIRIVFNMHVPQGGFQSIGEGDALWTEENMKRLAALWKAIAERYANEPTVLGYALINEPMVATDDPSKAFDILLQAYQYITDQIRSVDTNHVIFTERLYAVKNTTNNAQLWDQSNGNWNYVVLNDDNVVYEYHNYDPFAFTHQGAEWTYTADYDYSYPTEEKVVVSNPRLKTATNNGTADISVSDWQHVESELLTYDPNEANVLGIGFQAKALGNGGKAYVDNLTLKEYDENGNFIKDIYVADFEDDYWKKLSLWSANSVGTGEVVYGVSKTGKYSYCIADTTANAYVSYATFRLTEGHMYQATADIMVENAAEGAVVNARAELYKADSVSEMNKETIRGSVSKAITMAEKLGAPVYCGEVGASFVCFMRRGGEKWAEDMISLYVEYGVGFSYHSYSGGAVGDPGFGMYQTYDLPSEDTRNEKLYDVFKKVLANNESE